MNQIKLYSVLLSFLLLLSCGEGGKKTEENKLVSLIIQTPNINVFEKALVEYTIANIEEPVYIKTGQGKNVIFELDKTKKEYEINYKKPGIYKVEIKTASTTLDSGYILVKTNPFYTAVSGPNIGMQLLTLNETMNDSVYYANPEMLKSKDLISRIYWTDLKICQDFQLDGDNFTYEAEIKSNLEEGAAGCCDIVINLFGDKGLLRLYFVKDKCSDFIKLDFSEIHYNANNFDISPFVQDFSDYRNIRLVNRDKNVSVLIDDKEIFSIAYQKSIGKLYHIDYTFRGSAFVRKTTLYDPNQAQVYNAIFMISSQN